MAATAVTFPSTGATGDCMEDALSNQKEVVTNFNIVIDSHG
jgi:hypothetical protein